jgi:hypothetical protein
MSWNDHGEDGVGRQKMSCTWAGSASPAGHGRQHVDVSVRPERTADGELHGVPAGNPPGSGDTREELAKVVDGHRVPRPQVRHDD